MDKEIRYEVKFIAALTDEEKVNFEDRLWKTIFEQMEIFVNFIEINVIEEENY